jgi:hypothetical protein
MFGLVEIFQTNLHAVGMARSPPYRVQTFSLYMFRVHVAYLQKGARPHLKDETRLKLLVRDKHASLFCQNVSDKEKSLVTS